MVRFILFLAILYFQVDSIKAQVTTVFEGKIEFNSFFGDAIYEYREGIDGNIIYDGFFRFDAKEIDSLDQTQLTKFKVTGNFKDNKRDGRWLFDLERHRVNLLDVIDYEVKSSLESEDVEIKGNYAGSLPHGAWEFTESAFSDGEIVERAKSEGIKFDRGVMVGNVYFRRFEGGRTQFIRGEVSPAGRLQGEWSMVYLEDSTIVSEVRTYEDGFLLGLVRRDLETDEKINEVIFYSTIEKLNKLTNGKDLGFTVSSNSFGIDFNDGFVWDAEEIGAQAAGNGFIKRFVRDLLAFDESVDSDGTIQRSPLQTRRFEFELSTEDVYHIENIPILYESLRDSISMYSEMNSLRLNQNRNDSLAFSYAYFTYEAQRLYLVSDLVDLVRSGEIRYMDLDNLERDVWERLVLDEELPYLFNGDTLSKLIPTEFSRDTSESFFSNFFLYLSDKLESVSDMGSYVKKELFEIEVNSRLRVLESRIVQRKGEIDSLFQSYIPQRAEERQLLQALVSNFLESGFDKLTSEYAEISEFELKEEKGMVVLDMLDELEKRFPNISTLFERMEELDKIYLEETFNPFTYSRYDVRAKERLFDAGMTLFKEYLNNFILEEDYTEIKNHINSIVKLQDRLHELRTQDTRTLERRLGRRSSASRIESALNL
ncbi:MAG: hypothetical protein JJU34_18040 [Lunatimonas sp.]|uniref:hypothetical protein n=1 Tax=Lunatimonas sp. TaxID=2060141 RepID=UPI00263B6554|nr:hypothetical protein [Lunatimonas sp.]MCC5939186.1 hypothetical protein [Lunatimonas sp.]